MTPSKQPAKIPRPSIWANRIGPSGRNTHPFQVAPPIDPERVVLPAQATGLGTGATTSFLGRNTHPVSVLVSVSVSVFDPERVVLPAQATGLGTGATTGFLGRNTRPVSVLVSVFDPVRVVPPAQTTGLGMGATTGFQS